MLPAPGQPHTHCHTVFLALCTIQNNSNSNLGLWGLLPQYWICRRQASEDKASPPGMDWRLEKYLNGLLESSSTIKNVSKVCTTAASTYISAEICTVCLYLSGKFYMHNDKICKYEKLENNLKHNVSFLHGTLLSCPYEENKTLTEGISNITGMNFVTWYSSLTKNCSCCIVCNITFITREPKE